MRSKDAHELWVEGIELFNAGRFFDCHEIWEELWRRESGAEKLFYQGMIQAAVAILHAQRGNPRGARSTWHKARVKLESLPEEHMGIALGELREAVDVFVASAPVGRPLLPQPKIRQLNRHNK
jgi:predicted metal-dependent hydrolase